MGRYRKVDTRTWGDAKFQALSRPEPSGRYLWFFLLTGPHTTNLPGLFRAGEMGLAESLEWPVKGFRKAFGELFRQGLVKADWRARVVWIPNAIKYNQPESPNVVRSWRASWDEVPECSLKTEAYERLKAFTKALGESFHQAFMEACAKALANQEQEQEQEKEQEKDVCVAASATPAAPIITLPLNDGAEYPVTSDEMKEWLELYPAVDVLQELRKMRGWLLSNQRNRKTKSGIRRFVTNWLAKEQDGAPKRPVAASVAPVSETRLEYQLPRDLDQEAGEEAWRSILLGLATRVNRHSFDTWLKPVKVAGISGKVLYMKLPTV
ncbi:MAG: hypothetical protein C5B55_06765, partial [Blastocatellia bacterium]